MLLNSKLLALLLASFSSLIAANFEEESNVLVLDDELLKAAIRTYKKLFIMFYSPTCDHCKKALPEFEKAGRKLNREGFGQIKLAKIDTSTSPATKRDKGKFGFKQIPAFYYMNGPDIVTQYYGERKAADFISYVKKKAGLAWETITTISDLARFTDDEDVVILGLFRDENSREAEVFKTAATDIDGIPFALTSNKEIFEHLKLTDDSSHALVALKKFDEGRNFFSEEWDADDVSTWVKQQRLPLVIDFNKKDAAAVFTGETRRHIIFVAKKSSKEFVQHYHAFRRVAEKFRFKFLFIFIDADVKDNERIINFFQVGPRDYPAFRAVGIDDEPSRVLKPEDTSFNEETLSKFVKDVDNGKLAKRRGRKSQDEPQNWSSEPLKVLVARTMRSRILDRDAFVLFYKPTGCQKCPSLLNLFKDLADEYVYNQRVLIGKIDASENEVENVEIKSVPVIKFFPKGLTLALDYKGEHSIEAFVKYIDTYVSPVAKTEEHDQVKTEL